MTKRASTIASGAGVGLTRPEKAVFDRLRNAIVQQVLPPGTKLAEEDLARIYGQSRMRIRRVLLSLSHARVVTLFAGRGAFVAQPTPAEARAVFQARKLIETAVLAEMNEPATPSLVNRLRHNVAAGSKANHRGDRARAIQLSGAFHTELISEIGNPVVGGILEELIARSSLVIVLYHRGDTPVCRDDHHAQLVEILGGTEFPRAVFLMRHHLTEMEESLDFTKRWDKHTPLHELLNSADQGVARSSRKRSSDKKGPGFGFRNFEV